MENIILVHHLPNGERLSVLRADCSMMELQECVSLFGKDWKILKTKDLDHPTVTSLFVEGWVMKFLTVCEDWTVFSFRK